MVACTPASLTHNATPHLLPLARVLLLHPLCRVRATHASPHSTRWLLPLHPRCPCLGLPQVLKFSVGFTYISTLVLSVTGYLPFSCFTSVVVAYGLAGEMVKLAETNMLSEWASKAALCVCVFCLTSAIWALWRARR